MHFRVWPLERGGGYEFKDSIVGGVVPKQYIPGIEKGVKDGMDDGVLARFPVVDFAVELFFGSYHDVDSSEMSFRIAARNCLKKVLEAAGPILLEPVMEVDIFVDKDFMGDILNDITSRRGRVCRSAKRPARRPPDTRKPCAGLVHWQRAEGCARCDKRGAFRADY